MQSLGRKIRIIVWNRSLKKLKLSLANNYPPKKDSFEEKNLKRAKSVASAGMNQRALANQKKNPIEIKKNGQKLFSFKKSLKKIPSPVRERFCSKEKK